jgi:hypothetical protein
MKASTPSTSQHFPLYCTRGSSFLLHVSGSKMDKIDCSFGKWVVQPSPTHRKVGRKPHRAPRGFLSKVGPMGSNPYKFFKVSYLFIYLGGPHSSNNDKPQRLSYQISKSKLKYKKSREVKMKVTLCFKRLHKTSPTRVSVKP